MTKIIKLTITLIFVAIFWADAGYAGAACVNGNPSVPEEYKSSAFVISGRVLSGALIPASRDSYFVDGVLYRVRVNKSFKGKAPKTLRVFAELSSGGFGMWIGGDYLLFLYADHGRYLVDNCGNSGELITSSEKIRELDKIEAERR